MKITAEPRSDQWNAEDFLGGPQTFTIAGVKEGKAEQKYDIELVEGRGRAWRPPLTMLRALISAWGDDAAQWAGHRVTLYLDPTVRFGKETPGGIRISHLSHIDKPLKVALTVARGQKKIFTFQPLTETPAPKATEIPANVREQVASVKGTDKAPDYLAWLDAEGAPGHIKEYARGELGDK